MWHTWKLNCVFIAVYLKSTICSIYFRRYCHDFSFFLPSDSVLPCFIVTRWETWILSCPSLVAYTSEWWTVYFSTLHWQALTERRPEGRPSCLLCCMRAWTVQRTREPFHQLSLYLGTDLTVTLFSPALVWTDSKSSSLFSQTLECCLLCHSSVSGTFRCFWLFFQFSLASWLHNTLLLYKLSVKTFPTCKGWRCPRRRGLRPSFGE